MGAPPGFRVEFVVGGTQKGGTSALASFLTQHQEICFSKHKETHFFDRPDFPDRAGFDELNASYAKKFPKDWAGRIVGEATPVYMYLPGVAERVRAYNPAMKWVLLLRHPVDRAVSHYSMERARGQEWLPLGLALRAERFRLWQDRGWTAWKTSLRHHSYLDRGRYSAQIERLWRLFGQERVLVLTSEQLRERHMETLRTVFEFLGVRDREVIVPSEKVFVTERKVAVSERTRAWMLRRMRPEVERLERSLGRSLEGWRR